MGVNILRLMVDRDTLEALGRGGCAVYLPPWKSILLCLQSGLWVGFG